VGDVIYETPWGRIFPISLIGVAACEWVLAVMARYEITPNAMKTDDSTTESMMTSTEVMALIRINRGTLSRYCRRGVLPHMRMPDNSYRFERNSIQTWIAQRTIGGEK
jgi:predicted DNA-binding transcriptional regulator AlpA